MARKKWFSQFNIGRRNKHSKQMISNEEEANRHHEPVVPPENTVRKTAGKTDLTQISQTELQSQHAHDMPATGHKPAMTPSGGDAVRKDSVQKQPATPFEPKLLWDRAYDSLRGDQPGSVEAYERVLSCELSGTPTASTSKNQQNMIEQKDKEARRSQMRQLIDKGLAKTELEAKVKQGAGHVVDVVLASNHMISTALKGCPEAALAWTGVTFALQMIANPIKETETNRAGIEYVARKMDWYWSLSSHLLKERDLESKDYAGLQSGLEGQIIHLYKVLLSYQMKSVCSYYQNRGLVFLKDLVQLHDWEGQMNDVGEAVTAIFESSQEYSTQQIVDFQEQEMKTLRDIHHTLQKQTLVQRDSQEQAKKDQEEEKDRECLKELRLTNPEDDMKRIEDSKDPLLHESFVWILSHPCFIEWTDDKMTRLLWIKGDPGKGKTMLLIGIIKELSSSPHKSRHLSFFFCQATDAKLNNATAVLRGLVYHMLVQQPYLISHLRKEYDTAGPKLFEGGNAFPSMSRIFNNMLQDPRLNQVYLVVDALDECQFGLEQLLNFINETSAHPYCQVMWLVSSRNRLDIQERLCPEKGRIQLDLEQDAESRVFDAVSAYIDHKASKLARLKQYKSKLQADVQDYLHKNSSGTFLWVALVCKQLESTVRSRTLEILRSFPPGLQPFYRRMIDQIHTQCDSKVSVLCKQVLATSTLAYRPIHLKELIAIACLPEEVTSDQDDLKDVVDLCGSFLIVRNENIYFVHQSAKDYIVRYASAEIFPHERAEAHCMIVLQSLESMSQILRRNIYTLQHPGFCITDVHPPLEDPLASIQYACVYWVDHLHEMGSSHNGMFLHDNGSVDVFLKKHLLHWLEALSLMKSMSNGVSAISKLLSLVTCVPRESNLSKLVQDAHRFVLFNKGIIEDSPLQLYYSALIFSPVGSLTRHFFKDEEPHWITTKPVMEPEWGSCLQTLEGHSGCVRSVAFSSDSAHVVSGSDDKTVKIWDAGNGACLQTLKGQSGWVWSVAFSSDDACIASGSDDKTVKIWDAGNGACLQTLKGQSDWVWSVAFSSDGSHIASGSRDKAVKIWNVSNGACVQTLEGHSDWVRSVAFSPDGAHIASGSHDKTVKIWDAGNGACLQTLEDHDDCISSVAFSPDGAHVASGSHDGMVKIWDAGNGACLQTLEDHSDCISSVAFSPDGAHVASGSYDKTVKIWDAGNGACVQTLEGHGGWVWSVAFSSDGAHIASGSDDKTVKIWDASNRACAQAMEGHGGCVRSVVLSSDSTHIASGSHDKTVKIWNASNGDGACVQTLEGHGGWVWSVAFSSDGAHIASGSDDKTVKIWDASNKACLQTLEDHDDCISSVAFSSDGAQIASGSHDKTVKIWDASSGACLQTLEGHSDCISSVVFSSDGAQIASGSHDKTVKIWDTSNGDGACVQTLEGHGGWVRSVAFSPDGAHVASGSHDDTIKIWDASNGACLQTFEGQGYSVIFDATTSHFRTEMGILPWNGTSSTQKNTNICGMPRYQTYALNTDQTWITWNGQNVLWLPSEYRPSCSAIISSTMVIGCRSGLVLIFDFSNKAPLLQ